MLSSSRQLHVHGLCQAQDVTKAQEVEQTHVQPFGCSPCLPLHVPFQLRSDASMPSLQQFFATAFDSWPGHVQDAEFMEQKKSERAGRGANAWQPRARQQELDEEDRFQVSAPPPPSPPSNPAKTGRQISNALQTHLCREEHDGSQRPVAVFLVITVHKDPQDREQKEETKKSITIKINRFWFIKDCCIFRATGLKRNKAQGETDQLQNCHIKRAANCPQPTALLMWQFCSWSISPCALFLLRPEAGMTGVSELTSSFTATEGQLLICCHAALLM